MIFQNRKKKKVAQNFQTLHLNLSQRYGGTPPWTEGQVRSTVQHLKLDDTYLHAALLLFCGQKVLEEITKSSNSLILEKATNLLDVGGYRHYDGGGHFDQELPDFSSSSQDGFGGGFDGGAGGD